MFASFFDLPDFLSLALSLLICVKREIFFNLSITSKVLFVSLAILRPSISEIYALFLPISIAIECSGTI